MAINFWRFFATIFQRIYRHRYWTEDDVLILDVQKENKDNSDPASDSDSKDAHAIIFDEELGADKQTKRLVRYQMNPRANWGPMSRAK